MEEEIKKQQNTKTRTAAQDIAKGLLIIAVVFFHCFLATSTNPSQAARDFSVLKAMFPFVLSAFFFYAGYNYKNNDRTFKENISRRAKQLLIPLVIAFAISTIIITGVELIYKHDNVGGVFQATWNTILYSLMSEPMAILINFQPEGGFIFELIVALGLLWFIYVLFIASIFFYLLVKHTNKSLPLLIGVDIALLLISFCLGQFVGTYLPYCVQSWPVILAIMLTAAYLRQSHFLNRRVTSKKQAFLFGVNAVIAEAIIVGASIGCFYAFGATSTGSLPGSLFDDKLKGFDAFFGFIFGILGTYFIHTTCRLIKKIPIISSGLQWVGNHSALFYLFHPIFIELVGVVIFQKQILWGEAQAYFYLAICIIFLVGFSLLNDLIFKRRHKNIDISEKIREAEAPEDI